MKHGKINKWGRRSIWRKNALECPQCDGSGITQTDDEAIEFSPVKADFCEVCNGSGSLTKKQFAAYFGAASSLNQTAAVNQPNLTTAIYPG